MELALAIDLGGTKFAVGLVTRGGELVDREVVQVEHHATGEELYEDLERVVTSQMRRAQEHHGTLQVKRA